MQNDQATARSIPAHVPDHLVRDFNYFDQPDCGADPHAAWKLLHDGPDIIYTPYWGGHWVVTRGADIRAVLTDHATFSSKQSAIPAANTPFQLAPIEFDPPDHTRLKGLAVPSFSPTVIQEMEQEVRDYSNLLIDGFIDHGECEFVGDYALYLPIDIFMKLAGLPPSHRDMLLDKMEHLMRDPDPEAKRNAMASLVEYSRAALHERMLNPGADLISRLIAEGHARGASDDELLGYMTLLWTAGLDTVSSSMGFMARFLAENPAHRRELAERPALIKNAVEEMLRRFGVSSPSRLVTRDVELSGVALRKGEMILVPVLLYGLDDRTYDNPLEVDFMRSDAAQSMVFGTGIHRCIGSFLARMQLRIFIESWMTRIPDFHIAPGKTVKARAGVVNSMLTLPLAWPAA